MRIMYTRTILGISQIHRGRIILFSKGCHNPSFPLCAATAAPTQAVVALVRWQPPCQGAGAAAPTADRAGRGRHPLVGARQLAPFASAAAPAGGCRSLRARWPSFRAGPSRNRPPLAAVGCLLAGDLGRGLAVGGRPCIGAGRGGREENRRRWLKL
ncbi:hypothetical protein GW17_00039746 [Ensete ventricosum]|nr:hypothetical protein GW17_00039746 [Ensete ventricosum]